MRVLCIEDDPELCAILAEGLRDQHIDALCAADLRVAREQVAATRWDVIVLDVMLPGGSGFDFCAELRRQGISTPVIMLTARDGVDDRVRGLDAGADDYLTKPFAFRELLARLHALARRQPALAPKLHKIADLELDRRSQEVRRGGRPIALTAKEFALLECLVLHQGAVVDRAAITAHVWDDNHDPFTNVLEVLVRRVRRKIDDEFEPKLIHTVRGTGYRLGAPGP